MPSKDLQQINVIKDECADDCAFADGAGGSVGTTYRTLHQRSLPGVPGIACGTRIEAEGRP